MVATDQVECPFSLIIVMSREEYTHLKIIDQQSNLLLGRLLNIPGRLKLPELVKESLGQFISRPIQLIPGLLGLHQHPLTLPNDGLNNRQEPEVRLILLGLHILQTQIQHPNINLKARENALGRLCALAHPGLEGFEHVEEQRGEAVHAGAVWEVVGLAPAAGGEWVLLVYEVGEQVDQLVRVLIPVRAQHLVEERGWGFGGGVRLHNIAIIKGIEGWVGGW